VLVYAGAIPTTATPEPATITLLGIGIAGLAGYRLRRPQLGGRVMKRYLVALATLAMLAGGIGQASAASIFILKFDENGNGSISINGAPAVALHGVMMADPLEGGMSLTYMLPVTVANGDVGVVEPNSAFGTLSDMLRFTDANSNLTGITADRMIYYSELDPSQVQGGPGTDLADRVFQVRSSNVTTVREVGPEGNNSFQYGSVVGGNPVYIGISDVPEPATMTLFGAGVLGMAGYALRRCKNAAR
jgi:hypothetical protein